MNASSTSSEHDGPAPPVPTRAGRALLVAALASLTMGLAAASEDFVLGGRRFPLDDVTPLTEVFFQAMRFNRAQRVWNVDVSVRNKSDQPLEGPFVVRVDSFTGTGGPQSPDGQDASAPPKAYFDFSGAVVAGRLLPGGRSGQRTLTLGFQSDQAPHLTVRVFAHTAVPAAGLAFVRTLDEVGQPLPSVQVDPVGTGFTGGGVLTDDAFGLATLTQTDPTAALRSMPPECWTTPAR